MNRDCPAVLVAKAPILTRTRYYRDDADAVDGDNTGDTLTKPAAERRPQSVVEVQSDVGWSTQLTCKPRRHWSSGGLTL